MKHFRIRIISLVIAIAAGSAASTLLFINGSLPFAIMTCALTLLLALGLLRLVRRLIHCMQSFVSGLEMNDSTMRFDFGADEPELRDMALAMNRISSLYKNNMKELETRKIYYDRILKVMTHEMRNAITPIAAISADMTANPEKYSGNNFSEPISLIHDQSKDIKRFLDAYHSLTHIPAPDKEWVDGASFFSSVKTALSGNGVAENGEEVLNFIVSPGLRLHIDKGLMMQVMLNILRNAMQATGGSRNAEINVVATRSGDNCRITISDNGPGIPPEVAANLFQPFTTTKPGGSGIGLYLSRQIVSLHYGDMKISSSPGKGTSVIITLPGV